MRSKKIIILCLLMLVCGRAGMLKVWGAEEISVLVDGVKISFDQPPVLENGRTLVPMRAIFEALGFKVSWDSYYNSISATMTTGDISRDVYVHLDQLCLSVYERTYPVGSGASGASPVSTLCFFVPLDPAESPILNLGGRIMLPTRAIAEALGCRVDWDSSQNAVIIDTANVKITPPNDWVSAIEAHSSVYALDFLELKSYWEDAERLNQLALSDTVIPVYEPMPDVPSVKPAIDSLATKDASGGKVYTFYSELYNKTYEYVYTEPVAGTSPPVFGEVPARILIDEDYPVLSYPDPENEGKWIQNMTKPYSYGTYGGCNWYADGRFHEVYGIPFAYFGAIGARTYLDHSEKYDEFTVIRDVNDIREYSIAVFLGNDNAVTNHVLFVEYVERDQNGNPVTVYFTEANLNNPTGEYRHGFDGAVQKLEFSRFINRGGQTCAGYIIPNFDFYK